MSLITQFRGPVKSGKTLSAVYYALKLAARMECPVYTNMKKCKFRGETWAESVELDDLVTDMVENPELESAKFKNAVLLWDEAHIYFDTNQMRGYAGAILIPFLLQAGKRGMPVIYTTHLKGLISPRIRRTTEMSVFCKTNNHGAAVMWDVTNEKEVMQAKDEGYDPPPPTLHVLRKAHRMFRFYDTNEPISPASFGDSAVATKHLKNLYKRIREKKDVIEGAAPVKNALNVQADAAAHAGATRIETQVGRGRPKRMVQGYLQ